MKSIPVRAKRMLSGMLSNNNSFAETSSTISSTLVSTTTSDIYTQPFSTNHLPSRVTAETTDRFGSQPSISLALFEHKTCP